MTSLNRTICGNTLRDQRAKVAKIVGIGQSAGKDYAYILGVYLGDGWIYQRTPNSWSFGLETIDKEFAECTADRIEVLIGHRPNVRFREDRKIWTLVSSGDVFRIMKEDTAGKKFIPDYVKSWCRESQVAFIEGLMDSEGWIAKRTKGTISQYQMGFSCTSSWTYDFYNIVRSLGIQCGQPHILHAKEKQDVISFTINLSSWCESEVKFNIARKQNRVNEYKLKMRRSSSTTVCSA